MLNVRQYSMLLLVACTAGCAGIQVTSDYDPTVAFSELKTYDWIPDLEKQLPQQYSILAPRIRLATEAQLTANGYEKVTSDKADFLVGYHLATQVMEIETTDYYGYGDRRGQGANWRRAGSTVGGVRAETYIDTYEEGSLIIDFVDRETGKFIWTGTARAVVDQYASAKTRHKRLNDAVRLMLELFPPQDK